MVALDPVFREQREPSLEAASRRCSHPGGKCVGLGRVGLAIAALLVTAGVTLSVSRATAPSFDELPRLADAIAAEPVVQAVAKNGLAALVSTENQELLAQLREGSELLALLGAWARLSVARMGWLDPLTSARLPALVLAVLAPFMLRILVRPVCGDRVAWAAVVVLALHPAWLHACVVTAEGVLVAAIWVAVLGAYSVSLATPASDSTCKSCLRQRVGWCLIAAFVLGIGAALTRAAWWVLPLLVGHYLLVRLRSIRRLLSRSRVPLPLAAVFSLLLAPLLGLGLSPSLWSGGPAGVVRWWLGALWSTVPSQGERGPGAVLLAVAWLVRTSPLLVLLGALFGLGVLVRAAIGRRTDRLPGTIPGLRDPAPRPDIATLLLLGLGFSLLLAPWLPGSLAPGRALVEPVLPFFVAVAACGLGAAIRLVAGERWTPWGLALLVVIVVVSGQWGGLARLATTCAGCELEGDGSELGLLTARIDELGASSLEIDTEVPPEYWQTLGDYGWLRTQLVPVRPGGHVDLELVRGGPRRGTVLGSVSAHGRILWTLSRPE